VIFGGAHKNFGTSGLNLVLMKDSAYDRISFNYKNAKIPVPKLMDFSLYHNASDYVNTPTLMAIYITAN